MIYREAYDRSPAGDPDESVRNDLSSPQNSVDHLTTSTRGHFDGRSGAAVGGKKDVEVRSDQVVSLHLTTSSNKTITSHVSAPTQIYPVLKLGGTNELIT